MPAPAFHPLKYPMLLGLFALVVFWKIVLTNQYTMLAYQDSSFQTYPWVQQIARVVRQGDFPFWDPYTDAGRSFVGEMQTGAFYPPNLLLGLLPRNSAGLIPTTTIESIAILHVLLAALLMYRLALHLGLAPFSAAVSGLVFAFSGSIGLRAFAQLNLFYGLVWMPAAVLFSLKAVQAAGWRRRLRAASLAGLFLALSLLAGHHQSFLFLALAIASACLFAWIRGLPGAPPRRTGAVAASALTILACGCALAAVQLLPAVEYAAHAYRWFGENETVAGAGRVPYSIAADGALTPQGTVLFLFPWADWMETSPYLGILPLFLALFAAGAVRSNRWAEMALVLAALAAALAMGGYLPLHGLAWSLLPGFDKARIPARSLPVFHLGMALLAGIGCQWLLACTRRAEKPLKRSLGRSLGALSAVLALLVFVGYFLRVHVLGQPGDFSAVFFSAALMLGSSAVVLGRLALPRARRLTKAAILLLLLADYHMFFSAHIRLKTEFDRKTNYEPHQYYQPDAAVRFLRSQPGSSAWISAAVSIPRTSVRYTDWRRSTATAPAASCVTTICC